MSRSDWFSGGLTLIFAATAYFAGGLTTAFIALIVGLLMVLVAHRMGSENLQDHPMLGGITSVAITPNVVEKPVRVRVLTLADELATFAKETGPRPTVEVDYNTMSDSDILEAQSDEIGVHVEKVHFGYLARFKPRVLQIVNELRELGVYDSDLPTGERIYNNDHIRTISEKLYTLAGRIRT
jgi:hypothetical protein